MRGFSTFYHFITKKSARGSFLADVMVSMGILSLSITGSIGLISQSIQTNAINKNKVIAVNLAREGIEGVRLIRDTNWLRYGTQKRVCWNFWSNTNENSSLDFGGDEDCIENEITGYEGINRHPIGLAGGIGENGTVRIKNYILALDEKSYDWYLVENFYSIPDSGDVENQVETFRLTGSADEKNLTSGDSSADWSARKDIQGQMNSRLYLDKETSLYTHKINETLGGSNIPTDFYREIILEYPLGEDGFYPDNGNSDLNKVTDNQMSVTSKVWYRAHGGNMQSVTLETELTDYFERTNLSE
jgi:type II secretory pathway pseudopilin PulG